MRVLITGGAGYIGTELCIKLNQNPDVKEIIVLDNLHQANFNLFLHSQIKPGKLTFVRGELLDSRTLDKIIKDIDVVYHLAAENSDNDKLHHLHEQVNNWGTAELVYAIEESNVKQLVYVSSTAVYGYSDNEFDIYSIPEPTTSLGSSTLRGEQHVERIMSKINTQIIRLGNVFGYGVSMNMKGILNSLLFDSHFVGRISIHGSGNQKRPFISLEKTSSILANLLGGKLDSGVYNLVEYNKSIMDIVEVIQAQNPDMEMIFTNQHLELPQQLVTVDERIMKLYEGEKLGFEEELKILKEHFEASSL
ncbi:NAD-dependent epimerase/dehydratase family protein [Labilibaculum euxinus]|uniref:NAD-dependent epimerase/dehydratase family protein n=1 Tax=Labilibaculum euxinus TaxID=2686357 RepID=A0A7M4D1B3_9BACT|nr:SDR family oxidoreductase [Labilibaculum euxinus]MUP36442.1 NAD-dependent epimerase/dehydratase family protein [Labilibaculum euxinus]MVB05647.1 NAD-dependent epimerase/dehydratase family protein [Labilibaculum euxinus]